MRKHVFGQQERYCNIVLPYNHFTMYLLILPTIDSLCRDYGYDYFDETNESNLLDQQGLEAYHIEVNDGETFEIPNGFIGRIEQDEHNYYMKVLIDEDMDYYDKEEIMDDLPAGQYKLDEDTITLIHYYEI